MKKPKLKPKPKWKPKTKSHSAGRGFAAVLAALSSGERARSHRRVLSPDVVVVVLTVNCCAGRGKKKLQSWCRELCTRRPPCVRQLRCATKRRGRRSNPVPEPASHSRRARDPMITTRETVSNDIAKCPTHRNSLISSFSLFFRYFSMCYRVCLLCVRAIGNDNRAKQFVMQDNFKMM